MNLLWIPNFIILVSKNSNNYFLGRLWEKQNKKAGEIHHKPLLPNSG